MTGTPAPLHRYEHVKLLGQSHHNFEMINALLVHEFTRIHDQHIHDQHVYLHHLKQIIEGEAAEFAAIKSWRADEARIQETFNRFLRAFLLALTEIHVDDEQPVH